MPEALTAAPAAPAAAPSTSSSTNPALSRAFDMLNGMDHGGDGPQPEPRREEAKPAGERSRDATGKFAKPGEKPSEAAKPKETADANEPAEHAKDNNSDPASTGKTTEPDAADKLRAAKPAESPKVSGWAKFREEQKRTEQLSRELENTRKELEARKSQIPSVAEHPEYKTLAQRAEAAAKRAAELEDAIRYVDFTKSSEFTEQYQKPYEAAANNAAARAVQLKVTNEDGTRRNLTADEFWQIVSIGDEDDAIEAAGKLFGEGSTKAAALIERRNEVIHANRIVEQAKEKYRREGVERGKKAQADWETQQRAAVEQAAGRSTRFKQLNVEGEAHEKLQDVFKAADGDAEGAALLASGRHHADRAFNGGAALKEGETPWTPEELLAHHSVVRNRAGAFPYAVRQLRAATAKVAELEAKLKAYAKSEPGGGETRGDEVAPEGNALERALSKLDRMQ